MGHSRDAARAIQGDTKEVDTPGQILNVRVRDEIGLSGCEQPSPLSGRNGLFCFDESTAADFDLDKDEVVALPHDQVELAGRAPPLLSKTCVADGLELPPSVVFSRVAKFLARRSHYDERPHAATGEKQWRW
jgi:hypothetical protein